MTREQPLEGLQERMKKYAELQSFSHPATVESLNKHVSDIYLQFPIIYHDLQATVRALEVAREAIAYAIWQHEGGVTREHNHWTGKIREALQLINQTLGKAGV